MLNIQMLDNIIQMLDKITFTPYVFLGLVVIIALFLFYCIRKIKPVLARDEDMLFTTIGLFYSGILTTQGWRLDPILLFSQLLIISMVLFTGWENIRLRGLLAKFFKSNKKS